MLPVRKVIFPVDYSDSWWTATSDALNRPHKPYASVPCACDLGNDEEFRVVLKAAMSTPSKYGATLSLLNILELVPMAMEIDYAAFRTALRDAAATRLLELKTSLGIQAPHRIAEGSMSTAIREEAIRCKADLIVTGRGAQQGAVPGTQYLTALFDAANLRPLTMKDEKQIRENNFDSR